MCVAIYKPKNVILVKRVLKNCFENNPDGAGFAYPDEKGKQIVIERGFFGFRKFWRRYRTVQDRAMLIHFRIATSGKINAENCHPWELDKKHAFVHNGKIKDKLDGVNCDEISDTGYFVQEILAPLFKKPGLKGKHWWGGFSFKWLMEQSIGTDNKMAILGADGMATIFNEAKGEWQYETWFSNNTYREDRIKIRGTTSMFITDCQGNRREIITAASGRKGVKFLGKEEIKALPEPKPCGPYQSRADFEEALDAATEFKEAMESEGIDYRMMT